MLTGKCKEAFKRWYVQDEQLSILRRCGFTEFTTLPFQFQYGVYLEFFDSVGIYVKSGVWDIDDNCINFFFQVETLTTVFNSTGLTRQESQIEAIKKANDIFNAR